MTSLASSPACQAVLDDLSELIAGQDEALIRHGEHLAGCDDCRDARHEASLLAARLAQAGADHVPLADLSQRVLARLDEAPTSATTIAPTSAMATAPVLALGSLPAAAAAAPAAPLRLVSPSAPPERSAPPASVAAPTRAAPRGTRTPRVWRALAATAALAAAGVGIYAAASRDGAPRGAIPGAKALAAGMLGAVKTIDRASRDQGGGLMVREDRDGNAWRVLRTGEPLPAGAELRTDDATRALLELADGSRWTLDHRTSLRLARAPSGLRLSAGRLVADLAEGDGPGEARAVIETPGGRVEARGARFALVADDQLAVVQVVRGEVALASPAGATQVVRAGEEGVVEGGALAVTAAPGLGRELQWSELGPRIIDTEAGAGLGALRAYKPGESRDRDWQLALASHDVKVRIVGPVARTEITETFRNDSAETLEGVYQFPLPADAQIDALALDVEDAPGGFEQGAFVDKERAQKIWKGVIDKAAPRKMQIAQNEIIWVDGSWRDPALLDWKRGGRFELRIFPIPAKGSRTIKLAYTQVVAPRGAWRQYVYPLPHSADGSTVADEFSVDVEVRGARPGQVRAAGYDLAPDPARAQVLAHTLQQRGFVPRGDLVVSYRAEDGDAELRAWTYAGNFAVAPDERLAAKQRVGNDDRVLAEQRAVAADGRPTAVLALRPRLPRTGAGKPRDYMIVVDASQSMVGERYARASELAIRMVEQMDRRDRFAVMVCDSECRALGALRAPSVAAAGELGQWLLAQPVAGASDLVAAVRGAAQALPGAAERERWVLFLGDGFASTGFRRAGEVEQAIAESTRDLHVSTIGIGADADAALLAAAARGGGGSYLAWVPGQSVKAAAIAALESTVGPVLRDATITLPAGLADVAPAVLPTVRAGQEVLIASRVARGTEQISGDVVLKGTLGGQPFEQRYPLALAVSSAAGNAFVPRLWAQLAIEQLEQRGGGEQRPRIVALSQGYGVMSKETSLLVLESAAMFDAFGVDRTVPAAKWTGQEALDEVVVSGTMIGDSTGAMGMGKAAAAKQRSSPSANAPLDEDPSQELDKKHAPVPPRASKPASGVDEDEPLDVPVRDVRRPWGGGTRFAMRRTWVRVPTLAPYQGVSAGIAKVLGESERALARTPDSRERHRALVQVLAYAGELERARTLAAQWLERDRLDPQALGYQADLLGRTGQRELALRTLAGVVDLDADRAQAHERMAAAYQQAGRLGQACAHRIALSALAPRDAQTGAAALRCLAALVRPGDVALVRRGLADDATRAAAEQALATPPVEASGKREAVVAARWDGGEDLDLSLVTPDGTRVSWMGGDATVQVTGAADPGAEILSLGTLARGNYLVEIGRAQASGGASPAARGELSLTVLGSKRTLPFELAAGQPRVVVARIAVNLQERVESIDPSATKLAFGHIADANARRVILARSPSLQACFTPYVQQHPSARGKLILTVTIDGSTTTRASAGAGLGEVARCLEAELASMHLSGPRRTLRVPLSFSAP